MRPPPLLQLFRGFLPLPLDFSPFAFLRSTRPFSSLPLFQFPPFLYPTRISTYTDSSVVLCSLPFSPFSFAFFFFFPILFRLSWFLHFFLAACSSLRYVCHVFLVSLSRLYYFFLLIIWSIHATLLSFYRVSLLFNILIYELLVVFFKNIF